MYARDNHRPGRATPLAFFALLVSWPSLAGAVESKGRPRARSSREDRPTLRVVVDLTPAAGVPTWLAGALERNIHRELAAYERLAVVDKRDTGAAACDLDASRAADLLTSRACRIDAYRRVGVDVVLLGTAGDGSIGYELYQTWTPARLDAGSIEVGRGSSLTALQQQTLQAFDVVLTPGGLLDQKPYLVRREEAARDAARTAASRAPRLGVWLLAAAALLVFPFASFLVLVRGPGLLRLLTFRSARWAVLPILAAGVAGAALLLPPTAPRALWALSLVSTLAPRAGLAAAVVGGVLSAVVLLWILRVVFPPLGGLDRVAHQDVFRLVRAWSMASVLRLALCAVGLAPFAWAFWHAHRTFGVSPRWAVILLVPAVALLARLSLVSGVECLAAWLDDRIVSGPASADNPWHREIHRYLMGYLRRSGWDVDPARLDRVLYLPSRPKPDGVTGVVSYGGGAARTRIVVAEELLRFCMGEMEQAPLDVPAAAWPDWPAGLVAPRAGRARRASRRRRGGVPLWGRLFGRRESQLWGSMSLRARRPRSSFRPDGDAPRRQLGQAATLLGHVIPSPGESVPLISDNVADLRVVRELLSEHYAQFAPDAPDPDEEYDDTDPTDKDMLFGPLAREVGAIERGDTLPATFPLAFREAMRGGPVRRVLHAILVAPFERLLSRYPAILADGYAALNFARHHLVQYLYYLRADQSDLLTARARPGQLGATTQQIVSRILQEPPRAEDRPILRASPRNRLVWLARFTEQAREPREARFRKIFAALVVVVMATAAGMAVKRAIDYHPTYVERIRAQQSESAGLAVTPAPESATPPQPGGPPPHGGQTQANQE